MTRYKYQLLVIAASIVLFGTMYVLSIKPKRVVASISIENNSVDMLAYASIINSEKVTISQNNSALSKSIQYVDARLTENIPENEKIQLTDSISFLCFNTSPFLSADYCFQKSQISHQILDMLRAGELFLHASELSESNHHITIINKAIEVLEYAIKIDTSNADVKVSLASAYIENGSNPMKGIVLLKEVASMHPDNISAQFKLGLFSIKSGQYDKAVNRFNRVLELDSSYYQAYFYLGQCELELGNKQKSIENFKHYQYLCPNSVEKKNINQYINKLLTT